MALKRLKYIFIFLALISFSFVMNNLTEADRDISAPVLHSDIETLPAAIDNDSGIEWERVTVKEYPIHKNQITFPIAQSCLGTIIDPKPYLIIERINCRLQV